MALMKARIGNNLNGLYDFCNHVNRFFDTSNLTLLEIGTFAGESASIFAKYFKEVTCIDSWCIENLEKNSPMRNCIFEAEKAFDELIKKQINIIKIKGNSLDIEKIINKKFDVIYIDGEHSYVNVKNDILVWYKHATKFIAGHDYRRGINEDVIKAVHEILGKPDRTFKDWSWIVRVK
jgi:flagellin-specific chaperone FliS